MQTLPSLFRDKIVFLLLLSSTLFTGCWKDNNSDPIPVAITSPAPPVDPDSIEKAKQWKPTNTGQDKGSALVNGKAYNFSRFVEETGGNLRVSFLPPHFSFSDVRELPFQFGFQLNDKDQADLRASFFPKNVGRKTDTTVYYKFKIGDNNSYIFKTVTQEYAPTPDLPLNMKDAFDSRTGNGHGWVRINNYGLRKPGQEPFVFPITGTFEFYFYNGKDTLKFTNGWFDINARS